RPWPSLPRAAAASRLRPWPSLPRAAAASRLQPGPFRPRAAASRRRPWPLRPRSSAASRLRPGLSPPRAAASRLRLLPWKLFPCLAGLAHSAPHPRAVGWVAHPAQRPVRRVGQQTLSRSLSATTNSRGRLPCMELHLDASIYTAPAVTKVPLICSEAEHLLSRRYGASVSRNSGSVVHRSFSCQKLQELLRASIIQAAVALRPNRSAHSWRTTRQCRPTT